MNVVLVHGKFFNSWEAQGLGFIASYLRMRLPNIHLMFFQGSFDDVEQIIRAGVMADWVLFSCTTPAYQWCANIARQMKARGNPRTVIGGYHPSVAPEMVGPEFDHLVIGDGEEATYRLLRRETKERIVYGRPMEFSELCWPDRDVIRNDRNISVAAGDTGKRITSFQAHRGCPFGCRFCADGSAKALVPNRKACCRARNVTDLLNEIQFVTAKYSLDFFKFCDATWNLDPKWVKLFCAAKQIRKFETPFFANIHARQVDQEMFDQMAQAGCQSIGLGIESGSDRILKLIGKGISKEDVRRTAKYARNAGIHVRGYFMVGVPEETEADLLETERFAEELQLDEYGFTLLCPYPGTYYYVRYPELQSIDWANVDEYSNDFWHTETISNAGLKEWQGRLVDRFQRRITQHQRDLK